MTKGGGKSAKHRKGDKAMTVRELLTASTSRYVDVQIYTADNEEIIEGKNMVCNVLGNPFYAYILGANVVTWGLTEDGIYIRTDYEYGTGSYRVWFTFRNELGEDVRTYLDNNGEGFAPDDALDIAREMEMQGHKDVKITRIGTAADKQKGAENV